MFQGWVGSRLEALGAYAFWVISNAWFGAEVNYRTLIETLKGTLIDPLIGTLKGSLVLVLGGVGAGQVRVESTTPKGPCTQIGFL